MKVFYNEKQSTDKNLSASPSAGKPALLIDYWLKEELPIEIVSDFEPTTREQFYRAHEKNHIDNVLQCREVNGFGNKVQEVADTLPWTTGSFVAAAVEAWKTKTVTMSPTSGFHHASHNTVMGFCTFNGLMVAALELLEQGAERIGILDLDHHYGNGTDEIIRWLEAEHGVSPSKFHHYTFGKDIGGFSWNGAEPWLKTFPATVGSFADCDIVLFQAGADPHVDDPYGGALTSEQLVIRDTIAFVGLKELGIPVAWNLAGGYQVPIQKVLDIHTGTLKAYLKSIGR